MRWWLPLAVLTAALAAPAQDVFLGGRLDVELTSFDRVRFDFGRLAGVDATYSRPGAIEAYFDLSVAGGRARVQEFYATLPRTRRVVDVTVGRVLLPYGDRHLDVTDRYVDGGLDTYRAYAAWRTGNVGLDVDLTGLQLGRRVGPVALEAAGGIVADDRFGGGLRLTGEWGGWRPGASVFWGTDAGGAALTQGALHVGWSGGGVEVVGQGFLGRATGGDHAGWLGRLSWRLPATPLTLFVARTAFDSDGQRAVASTRLGAVVRLDDHWRCELRGELNSAPAPADHHRLVLRALAVF